MRDEVKPTEGKDRLGRYVYRCANCKNKIGVLRSEWAHATPASGRCKDVVPYRAPS